MRWILVLLSSLTLTSPAFAYYSFQDTGDLLKPGAYAAGGELQFITEHDSGINVLGRFDGGWNNDLNYRAIVGFGEVDFQLGGFVKWVPIPDVKNQPAMGITAGALVASYSGNTEIAARVYPFLSKDFDVEDFGKLTPYVSLPLGVRTFDGDSDATSQLILGSRYINPGMKGAQWFFELGFDLDNAPAFVGVGATFPLNEEKLIDLWSE